MSYFDPKVYNIDNLKPEDRNTLKYWCERFVGIIESVQDIEDDTCGTLNKIKGEIIEEFCNELYGNIASLFQEETVYAIDNYPDEDENGNEIFVEEVANPTTFYDFVEELINCVEGSEDND